MNDPVRRFAERSVIESLFSNGDASPSGEDLKSLGCLVDKGGNENIIFYICPVPTGSLRGRNSLVPAPEQERKDFPVRSDHQVRKIDQKFSECLGGFKQVDQNSAENISLAKIFLRQGRAVNNSFGEKYVVKPM